jgi:hypothetical protein
VEDHAGRVRDAGEGAKALLKRRALRVDGVQLARVQRLRDAFFDLVINTAVGTFLPG